MSSKYKTVIHISSRVESPRERTGSDPQAYGAAARLRKDDSSPSSSKHVSLRMQLALSTCSISSIVGIF